MKKLYLSCCFILLLFSFAANAQTPVAYYPFNGNANDAIGTHHGIPNAVGVALTADRFGNANSAYNFDGVSGFISLSNSTDFQNSEFTYSAWVKENNIFAFAQAVISIGSPATNQTISLVNITSQPGGQTWQFFTYLVGSPAIPFVEVPSPNNTAWHQVVGTRSINELKLYVDGILIGSAPTGGFLPAYNTPMLGIIGSRPDNTQFFNGAIDEVKIYNTVLTPLQVQQDFASSNRPQKSGSGNAISFNGSTQSVNIPNAASINFGINDFSLGFWYNSANNARAELIFEKRDDNCGDGQNWSVRKAADQIYLEVNVPGPTSDVVTIPNASDGKWHHIIFARTATQLSGFKDGILIATTSTPAQNVNNSAPVQIGTGPCSPFFPGGNGFFNGSLDEIQFWNIALTQSQIRDRMCKKITTSDALYSNLVAYYNFDESNGTTVFDGTINANNGTLINTPTRVTSGAAIGNASSHDYVNAIKTVSLTHATGENLTVTSTSGSPAGIQVYMVDEKPNTLTGASGVGDNNKYFGVFQVNGTTPQYTAVYNYNGNPFVNPGIEAQLRLNKRTDNTATTWTVMTAIPNEPANTITVTGESTEYILGRLGGALPLNLISFTGSKQNNDALLQWKTANEINTSRFEIQRSENGIDFITAGTVAAGSSLYSFADVNTFITKQIVFYRLKSIDADGKFSYSGIVKLSNEQGGRFTIFPNPVKDIITISGLKQNGTLLLFTADGKLLLQQKTNTQSITMDLSSYATGTYLLQYENEGVRHTQKLIKH